MTLTFDLWLWFEKAKLGQYTCTFQINTNLNGTVFENGRTQEKDYSAIFMWWMWYVCEGGKEGGMRARFSLTICSRIRVTRSSFIIASASLFVTKIQRGDQVASLGWDVGSKSLYLGMTSVRRKSESLIKKAKSVTRVASLYVPQTALFTFCTSILCSDVHFLSLPSLLT